MLAQQAAISGIIRRIQALELFDEKYLHIHSSWKQQQVAISMPCATSNRQNVAVMTQPYAFLAVKGT